MANGHSRRSVLKMGLGLAAAVVAGARAELANAEDPPPKTHPGNMTCAEFCATVFPPGEARGRCVEEAAQGQGVCFQCGPQSSGSRVLCGTVCCPKGLGCCGGECVRLDTEQNCGRCGNVCGEGLECAGGECLCPGGEPTCFGQCCPEGSFCEPFFETCQCFNGQLACGGTFPVCCEGRTCCEGVCCPEGFGCCGGVCCNRSCCPGFRPTSHEGICCASGETCCGSACANLLTSAEHCGNCFSPCPAGQSCCGGECFDLDSDPRQCGACDVQCLPGQQCVSGECVCPNGGVVCSVDLFRGTACCEPGQVCCVHPFAPEGQCLFPDESARRQQG